MPVSPAQMTGEERRLRGLLSWIAGAVAATVAVAVPLIFFWTAYTYEVGRVSSELESPADRISRLISTIPEMWRYQTPKFEQILEESHRDEQHYRVLDGGGHLILESGPRQPSPTIARETFLHDGFVVVGKLQLISSLRPLAIKTGVVAAFGLVLGLAVSVTLRVLPIRALDRALDEARQARAQLVQAIESISEGFALYDAEDRLVICNNNYKEIYTESAEAMVPGAHFEEILRFGLERGQYAEAVGREQEWLADRMRDHRKLSAPVEQELSDRRWLLVTGRRTPDGGTVGIRTDITELKHREDELVKSKRELVELVESLQEGFALFDQEDRLVLFNREYRNIFSGLSDIVEPGAKFQDLVSIAADRGQNLEALVRNNGPAPEEYEGHRTERSFEHCFADGRWVRVREKKASDGKTLTTYVDISRLKRREEELLQAKDSMQAIVDTASDAIFTISETGTVDSFNAGGERIFGYPAEGVVGCDISLLIPSFHRANKDRGISSVLDPDGESNGFGQEVEALRKDGSTIILELSVGEMHVNDRRTFTAIARDITKRHQDDEALRAKQAELHSSQQRLSAIMNSVVDAVISIDDQGIIHSFSAAAERIFGYSVAEAIGKNVALLMPEPHRSRHDGYIKRFLETGEAKVIGSRTEATGQRKDGTTFPLEIAVNWMDLDGSVLFVGVCRDITGRKQAVQERAELERDLLQAQKMESLGTLSGGIAHEINTPVQYVGDNVRFMQDAFSDLGSVLQKYKDLVEAANAGGILKESVAEVEDAVEAADLGYLLEEIPTSIEQSLEGVGRISEIVQAIKEFSHPDAKEKTVIDINHAIGTTITVTRNQWKYVAELETDFDAELPQVPCLPGEFNQVILNLIVNAAHAIEDTGGKGRIVVATRRTGDWAEIRVSDTGVGVPQEIQEKVFDPFFTTKEPGKGSGQGLAISHSIIVKKHGGTISLDSVVGEGTTFIVRLPLSSSGQAEEAA